MTTRHKRHIFLEVKYPISNTHRELRDKVIENFKEKLTIADTDETIMKLFSDHILRFKIKQES